MHPAPFFARSATICLAGAALTLLVSAAHAEDASYCVVCKNPDQTYRCQFAGEGARPNDALKLYCTVRTAKEGHHASCSATRDTGNCSGPLKTFSLGDINIQDAIAENPKVQKLMAKAAREQKKFDKPAADPNSGPPQTLVQLTNRAVTASRRRWDNARDAISGKPQEADASALPAPTRTPLEPPLSAANPPPTRVQRVTHAAANASAAVGSFARKSYHCVWSLFRHCGDGSRELQASE